MARTCWYEMLFVYLLWTSRWSGGGSAALKSLCTCLLGQGAPVIGRVAPLVSQITGEQKQFVLLRCASPSSACRRIWSTLPLEGIGVLVCEDNGANVDDGYSASVVFISAGDRRAPEALNSEVQYELEALSDETRCPCAIIGCVLQGVIKCEPPFTNGWTCCFVDPISNRWCWTLGSGSIMVPKKRQMFDSMSVLLFKVTSCGGFVRTGTANRNWALPTQWGNRSSWRGPEVLCFLPSTCSCNWICQPTIDTQGETCWQVILVHFAPNAHFESSGKG